MKKILALCLVVILAVTAVTGATLAYFTDKTQEVTNTFSVGGIDITLDEAQVDFNEETYVYTKLDGRTEKGVAYDHLIPGHVLPKDPTIHVDADSQDCYLAATVTITGADLEKIRDDVAYNFYNIISGGLTYTGAADTTYAPEKGTFDPGVKAWKFDNVILTQLSDSNVKNDKGEDTNLDKIVVNYFVTAVHEAGDNVPLFTTISIPSSWDNDEMKAIKGLNIEIKAYAAQAFGFDSCLDAMAATWAGDLHVAEPTA